MIGGVVIAGWHRWSGVEVGGVWRGVCVLVIVLVVGWGAGGGLLKGSRSCFGFILGVVWGVGWAYVLLFVVFVGFGGRWVGGCLFFFLCWLWLCWLRVGVGIRVSKGGGIRGEGVVWLWWWCWRGWWVFGFLFVVYD